MGYQDETRPREDFPFFKKIKAGTLSGAYYLYGDEPYSRAQAEKQIFALLGDAAREMNLTELKSPTADAVIGAADTMPFFDERRVVIARDLAAEECEKLAKYVPHMPESTILLVTKRPGGAKSGGKGGEGKRGDALFTLLKKDGRTVNFEPYDDSLAAGFAVKRAEAAGAPIECATAGKLVGMLGTDLFALESAVSKLAAYVGYGNRITPEALDACVTPTTEYKIFALSDNLAAGNKKAALTQLAGMLQNGDSALGLSSFLEGRFKLMLKAKQLLESGVPEKAAAKQLGGSPYAAEMTVKKAKRCSISQLTNAVIRLADVDALQKQGRMKDADALLLALVKTF